MFILLQNPSDTFLFTSRPYFSLSQDLNALRQIITYRQRIAKVIRFVWDNVLGDAERQHFQEMVRRQQEIWQKQNAAQRVSATEGFTTTTTTEPKEVAGSNDISTVEWPEKQIDWDHCSWKYPQPRESTYSDKGSKPLKHQPATSLEQSLCTFYNASIAPYFDVHKIACTLDHLRKSIQHFKSDMRLLNYSSVLQVFDVLEKQKSLQVDFFLFGKKIEPQVLVKEVKKELKKRYKDRYSDRKDLDAKWEHLTKTNVDTMKINVKWEIPASEVVAPIAAEASMEKKSTAAEQSSTSENTTQPTSTADEDNTPPEEIPASTAQVELPEYTLQPTPLFITSDLTQLLPQYPLRIPESKKRKRIVSESEDQFFSLKRFKQEDRPGRRRLNIPKEHLVPDALLQYLGKSNTLLHRVCNQQLQQQIIDIDKANDRKERLLSMLKNFPDLEQFVDEILFVLGEKEIDLSGK